MLFVHATQLSGAIPESAVWYAKSFKNETNLVENNLLKLMPP
jgi:hypothetical protein|tara:strand:- start:135 stop:260 length:126 start_codon:yes stop_codon:yes gene_type:complete